MNEGLVRCGISLLTRWRGTPGGGWTLNPACGGWTILRSAEGEGVYCLTLVGRGVQAVLSASMLVGDGPVRNRTKEPSVHILRLVAASAR
jgi:hypothetical protein